MATAHANTVAAANGIWVGQRLAAAKIEGAAQTPARIFISFQNSADEDDDVCSLQRLAAVDARFPHRVVAVPFRARDGPLDARLVLGRLDSRLVLSPCGSLRGDADDVRRVADAAAAGAHEAIAMGATNLEVEIDSAIPATEHPADGKIYRFANLVARLAVDQASYVPLQELEARLSKPGADPAKRRRVEAVEVAKANGGCDLSAAIEAGRELARDIGSADPERMTPARLAEAVRKSFAGMQKVTCEEVDKLDVLKEQYPLLFAVARASLPVERHHPRVVRITFNGGGEIKRTVCVAGKGVTYDTGGADVKGGGSMAGMRRDKCGAAAAAGFIKAVAEAPEEKTRHLRVVVELGCVRNSTGADAYVADEIITGHAGKRVLVGNTDMEGRMVLADCLSHLRADAVRENWEQPTFMSLATLTGHAILAHGPYAAAVDNAAARAKGGVGGRLAAAGALLGQPMDVSELRREDFEFVAPGTTGTPVSRHPGAYDVLQTSTGGSTTQKRGHQFPAAFLAIASGLQEHSAGSERPFPFCHVDLAGSVADGRGIETGSPIVPMFGHFVMDL